MHPSTAGILRHFEFGHLPPDLQAISAKFHAMAHEMANRFEGPELTVGLRKLLESKDCMVRAAVDLRGIVKTEVQNIDCSGGITIRPMRPASE
jgi:hypothetical protein